jgi:5-deoxy-glucuronate isomerase
MQYKHKPPFNRGFTMLSARSGETADMLMDFGVLRLNAGDEYATESLTDEQCWLMAAGECELSWGPIGGKRETKTITRADLFDAAPWCLSAPAGSRVIIKAGPKGCELYYVATDNPKQFAARLFTPQECRSEMRGQGTMRETSTRVVRTCWDDTTRSESNLVIGEVIGVPGKWSSYPPHHHPQPEIYHYRFLPEQGFGLCLIGDTPHVLHDKDTIAIREGEVHPHVTAPGYAMWYLWVIRHLEGAHYGPATNTPIFVAEHNWTQSPDGEQKMWLPKL